MKHITIILLALFSMTMVTGLTSCSPDDTPEIEVPSPNPDPDPSQNNYSLQIKVGSATFSATLQNNTTAKAFRDMLPMTINMSELNNNEKYYDLPQSLPSISSNPGTIQNGDIMLYGSRTLVLFYKTFSTPYSYTHIGSVNNPSGLQAALGSGSITAIFDIVE